MVISGLSVTQQSLLPSKSYASESRASYFGGAQTNATIKGKTVELYSTVGPKVFSSEKKCMQFWSAYSNRSNAAAGGITRTTPSCRSVRSNAALLRTVRKFTKNPGRFYFGFPYLVIKSDLGVYMSFFPKKLAPVCIDIAKQVTSAFGIKTKCHLPNQNLPEVK